MNDIKLKAWDIGNKVMVDNALILTPRDKQLVTMNAKYFARPTAFFEGCIWLRYTGLKDKNGVEICEGDILRFDSSKLDLIWHTDPFLGEVLWCTKDARFVHTFRKERSKCLWYYELEIIGTIYENPEILEEETDG